MRSAAFTRAERTLRREDLPTPGQRAQLARLEIECPKREAALTPKSKQKGLPVLVDTEMRGFHKAQERLREIIAMGGTEAIARLADVRDERQMRPVMFGNMRTWVG